VNKGLTVLTDETEYCLVMDADHHPRSDHAARAVATMERFNLDVLQVCAVAARAAHQQHAHDQLCMPQPALCP
jgi:hypothetical protein